MTLSGKIFNRPVAKFLVALVVMGACLITLSAVGPDAAAQRITKVDESKNPAEFIVPVHQSQVLRLDVPYTDALVGNPEIADVLPLTDRSIYVLGKGLGTTSIVLYGKQKKLIAVVDLVVTYDIKGLKTRLFEVMPDERIEIRPANGALVLSGTISSSGQMAKALAVAERFAPGKVTNLLSVKGSQQVMLSVRFVEIARTTIKELGLNTIFSGSKFNVTTGDALLGGIAESAFAVGEAIFSPGTKSILVLFDALEQKGVVKTLAEPNLIAMSGDTASFLAGGEFPVPVSKATDDGGSTITVEFKEFGISLSFTPTVLDGGLINIMVAPEVSKIDPNNSVTLSGFEIPGLTTRRAKTTVELRDGESFAIAGLIQTDFQDTVRQFPLLGDVPVIGALFRNTDFERNESELVIVVTPHLVKPAPPGALTTPDSRFVLPSDPEIFLFGRTESGKSGLPRQKSAADNSGAEALSLQGAGGIDGRFGHIIK